MGIFCKGRFIGGAGEIEAESLLNTGSDYVILPRHIAERISPRSVGEDEFELADGSIVRRKVYEVLLEIEDHAGMRRSCGALCTIEERLEPAIGFEVMEKLKLRLIPAERKAYFE